MPKFSNSRPFAMAGERSDLSVMTPPKPDAVIDAAHRLRTRPGALTVVLADDHRMVREALVPYISRIAADVTVLQASTLNEVIDIAAAQESIDLFLIDLYMPGMHGVSSLLEIRKRQPNVPIAIVSGSIDRHDIESALALGAAGYLPKTMIGRAFVDAVSLILNGERFVPSEYYVDMRQRPTDNEPVKPVVPQRNGLTARQWQVLRLLATGRANKEIANLLNVEEITVKVHVQAIFRALQVKNRTQAAGYALRRGWFPPEGPNSGFEAGEAKPSIA